MHDPGDATLTGWTITAEVAQDGAFFDCCGYTSLTPSDGLDFLDMTGDSNNDTGGISQAVQTVIGHRYALTFDVGDAIRIGTHGATSTIDTSVGTLSFSDTNSDQDTALTGETFPHDVVAGSTSTTIAFNNGDSVGDDLNGLDNVRLIDVTAAVPEPNEWMLMLLGLGGLGLAHRHRRCLVRTNG